MVEPSKLEVKKRKAAFSFRGLQTKQCKMKSFEFWEMQFYVSVLHQNDEHIIRTHWSFLMPIIGPRIGLSGIYQASEAKLL